MNPGTEDFRRELQAIFQAAMIQGKTSVVITARDLHNGLGAKNCYPSCCNAMLAFFDERKGDKLIAAPPSRKSPTVCIQYALPKNPSIIKGPKKVAAVKMPQSSKVLQGHVNDLINNFEDCLDHFYAGDVFTGPCVYFHDQAINTQATRTVTFNLYPICSSEFRPTRIGISEM
jgi:hypothetical protein